MSNIIACRWLDLNCEPLVSEVTALPTQPQPLPWRLAYYITSLLQSFCEEVCLSVFELPKYPLSYFIKDNQICLSASVCLSVSLSLSLTLFLSQRLPLSLSLSLVYCVLFNSYLESFVVKKEVWMFSSLNLHAVLVWWRRLPFVFYLTPLPFHLTEGLPIYVRTT